MVMTELLFGDKPNFYEEREGCIEHVTPKAFRFFDDGSSVSEFVPKSLIHDWWFVDTQDQKELSLDSLQRNDEIVLVLPRWFVKKEFLGVKRAGRGES